MERPGSRLKRARERLKLTYREVEEASQRIAGMRGSDEFAVALSRLADIENKGTLPTIYRMYTLCAIYRLDLDEVLDWYGVPVKQLASEAMRIGLAETHVANFGPPESDAATPPAGPEIDLNKTAFLTHLGKRWGRLPLNLLNGLDPRQHRYGFIGLEDRSMYPVLQPGSLVLIDQSRRKIASGGWSSEHDRPIYFFEHRDGYYCGWCHVTRDRLLLHPHPASQQSPTLFDLNEIDIIGQVVGVAMLLESH